MSRSSSVDGGIRSPCDGSGWTSHPETSRTSNNDQPLVPLTSKIGVRRKAARKHHECSCVRPARERQLVQQFAAVVQRFVDLLGHAHPGVGLRYRPGGLAAVEPALVGDVDAAFATRYTSSPCTTRQPCMLPPWTSGPAPSPTSRPEARLPRRLRGAIGGYGRQGAAYRPQRRDADDPPGP